MDILSDHDCVLVKLKSETRILDMQVSTMQLFD